MSLGRYVHDPIAFTDDLIPKNEKGQRWTLSAYQRRVLRLVFAWDAEGRLGHRLLVWSEPKKSGKTFVAAVLTLWWAYTNAHTEVIVVANDYEQAAGRVFKTIVDLCRANPALAASVSLRASDRVTVSNGTTITPIASEYRGPGTETSLRLLTESLTDQARLRSLLHRLAYRLGSDPALIDVPHALVAVPGTRCERVHPTRTVHVETWGPDRQYPLTEIERWLDQG